MDSPEDTPRSGRVRICIPAARARLFLSHPRPCVPGLQATQHLESATSVACSALVRILLTRMRSGGWEVRGSQESPSREAPRLAASRNSWRKSDSAVKRDLFVFFLILSSVLGKLLTSRSHPIGLSSTVRSHACMYVCTYVCAGQGGCALMPWHGPAGGLGKIAARSFSRSGLRVLSFS